MVERNLSLNLTILTMKWSVELSIAFMIGEFPTIILVALREKSNYESSILSKRNVMMVANTLSNRLIL